MYPADHTFTKTTRKNVNLKCKDKQENWFVIKWKEAKIIVAYNYEGSNIALHCWKESSLIKTKQMLELKIKRKIICTDWVWLFALKVHLKRCWVGIFLKFKIKFQ
jgi:hypothetical protein